MHLTLWQPLPSFHQEGFLCALAEASWVSSVTLRYETELPESRRASGWRTARFDGVLLSPITPDTVPEPGPEHTHIFTGFLTHPGIWRAFAQVPPASRCQLYAYAEAPELHDWRAPLRLLKYTLAARRLTGRLHGILAIGEIGETFYRRISGEAIPVHPFAYYDCREANFPSPFATPAPASPQGSSLPLPPPRPYRFLIVGQLIRRKGIDLALEALAACAHHEWTLDLVGDGPAREALRSRVRQLGLEARVRWHGVQTAEALNTFYASADCVLLPSRWDGWGMTINEALRHGCEVGVSRTAGVAALVGPDRCLPPSSAAWPVRLEQFLFAGPPSFSRRNENQTLARKVSAEAGVVRLHEILFNSPRRSAMHSPV